MIRSSLRLLPAATLAAIAPSICAQTQEPALQSEVEYIRGLVTELNFVPYAQTRLDELKKEHKDSKEFMLLAQLDVEISLQGARRNPDREQRKVLYSEALKLCQNLIERYQGEKVALDAQNTLLLACLDYGDFLNTDLDVARNEDPEQVPELEKAAAEVFRLGVDTCQKIEAAYQQMGEKHKFDRFVAWLRRGILLREHGRAVKKDRDYLCNESQACLEELAFEVGEETILGQKALFEIAKISEVRGKLEEAIVYFNDAITQIWAALTSPQLNLPPQVQRLMFEMMQEVFDRRAEAHLKLGRNDEVLAAYQLMQERIKEFQTEAHPRWGDSLKLTYASVLAGSDSQQDVSNALKTAQEINDRHPADSVGLKAKSLIRTILAGSADLVTGALLREIAIGDYQEQNYEAAALGFKKALRRMDKASRDELGFDTWMRIGQCNTQMQRHLEATMAYAKAFEYKNALEANATEGQDTEQMLELLGSRITSAFAKVEKASGKAPIFAALGKTANTIRSSTSRHGPDAQRYREASKLIRDRKFAEAAAAFFQVTPQYDKYSLAQARGIQNLVRADKFAEAAQRIAAFRQWVGANPLKEKDRARRAYRPQALAWVHYYEGQMLYEQANGTGKNAKPDLTKFRGVVKHFLEFESKHGKASSNLSIKAHEILGHSYLVIGEDDKAMARYNTLKELGKDRPDAHKFLGTTMFSTYSDNIKALQAELDAMVANSDKDQAKVKALANRVDQAKRRALNLGLDYCKTIGQPSYAFLYNCMSLAEDIEEHDDTQWAAERILAIYGDKKEAQNKSFRKVRATLGYALLKQPGRMREAYEILDDAAKQLAKGKKTVSYYEVLRYKAQALGGWPAMSANGLNYQPNPGMGKPDEAYDIYAGRDFAKRYGFQSPRCPRYSLPWYRMMLESLYFCRAAEKAGMGEEWKERANKFYRIARATDEFATLKSYPGGEDLARLYLYLSN